MKKFIDIILLMTVLLLFYRENGYTQSFTQDEALVDSSKTVILYFRFDRSLLEKEYLTNAGMLEKLRTIMTDTEIISGMDSIIIQASASPEGYPIHNKQLAIERAAAVKSYLMWQYPYLDRNKILTYSIGEDWDGLRLMVAEDPNVPARSEVLEVINLDIDSWKKENKLRQIDAGKAFSYLSRNIFPYLRAGATCITFFRPQPPADTSLIVTQEDIINIEEPQILLLPEAEPIQEVPNFSYRRPIALKTNLLFDLATLLNVEAEVPVAKHISIAGELMFPWWLQEKKQNCFEILAGTLEGRYWFNPNYKKQDISLANHNPLTGWFLGIYGSMGKYDLEWEKKGYQGEVYLSGGLTFGYSVPLKRNLNMEFSLSAGYLQSDYWRYQAKQDRDGDWHLMKQYPGTFHWFGPTKAKISLVWYPHFKSGRKGGGK